MVSSPTLKDDPLFGADSRWSWISAIACCCVLFLALATPRVAGIFFYGIVETFMVSREEASWPVSLAGTLMVLAGPVAGNLCERYSCRVVLLTCSSLAGIGAGLCYLAGDLIFITIFFGIVQGYFRDSRGDYGGLLHLMAAVNAFFVCVWTMKVVTRRRAASRLSSKSTESSKTGRTDSPRSCDPINSNG
ncbi:monocarboxylate transporter 6-like [Rhipicephalus sanguineus]|uniref:monocarboxylate transporter 6-like n=1 Tax=Rhipicephalus sanguineus TaxID=34632 RepID=UPI0020C3595D|nr:monocarboxylate transporter 6-like [Rhipicephalus sanguineus]